MKIKPRKVEDSAPLSEETNAFSAEVWIRLAPGDFTRAPQESAS